MSQSTAEKAATTEHHSRPGPDAGAVNLADGLPASYAGLREHFTAPGREIPFEDMRERMLFAEAVDAIRCLDEGVLRSVPDANVGSLLGIGFPPWTGGVLQYVNGYEGGLPGFVAGPLAALAGFVLRGLAIRRLDLLGNCVTLGRCVRVRLVLGVFGGRTVHLHLGHRPVVQASETPNASSAKMVSSSPPKVPASRSATFGVTSTPCGLLGVGRK